MGLAAFNRMRRLKAEQEKRAKEMEQDGRQTEQGDAGGSAAKTEPKQAENRKKKSGRRKTAKKEKEEK